jgi:tetraacyldisaccharide 4'-kinase
LSWERTYRELVSGRWKGPVPAALRGTLAMLEGPYAWFVRRRNRQFDHGPRAITKVAAPVISVGNLTVGGTGKTPLVAWLARWLTEQGRGVTIISRGYGARAGAPNDEALELASRLPDVPHFQNPHRAAAAQAALAENPDHVLLLDDAFQHRRLARDLDIVLLDALAPFGYDHLLPRGLLREPVSSLARAHVVALSRSNAIEEAGRKGIEEQVRRLAPDAVWVELVQRPAGYVSAGGQRAPLDSLRGAAVAAFCGIGNPAGFRQTLAECGVVLQGLLELPDHCRYGPRELRTLQDWLGPFTNIQAVVCTHKDLVKIPQESIAGKRLLALEIEVEVVRGLAEWEARLRPTIA